MINVLVFPCGSEIGLEINNSLKYDKHITLFGLSSVPCHGRAVYENYIEGIPFITDSSFIEKLNDVINENNIDVLIPAFDDVVLYFAENADFINCKIATSTFETCLICRSKKKTYQKFENDSFVPKTFSVSSIKETDFPLFAKPDISQGSQGATVINSITDLNMINSAEEDYVICEMLPGEEYTIDCFTNEKGELIIASMRERKRIKMGISVNSISVEVPEEIMNIANSINSQLVFNGVWFFQIKRAFDGSFKLLEIAPRVAGSMSTSRVRGFNYILNTVYQTMGVYIKPIDFLLKSSEVDRSLSNTYFFDFDYSYVYVDFDDTISLRNKVNISMIAFIYQCINKNKKVILLTRHKKDIFKSLKEYCIDQNLFYDIISFNEGKKSDYISHDDSIFIDDSFSERADVSANCKIPVFDLDAVTALIDWRYF